MEPKAIIRTLTSLSVLVALSLSAQAAPGDEEKGTGGPVTRALAQIDTDGDGQLSLDEFVEARLARAEERFLTLDTDGDGLVTPDDFDGERPEPPEGFDRDAFEACVEEAIGRELPERSEPGDGSLGADLDGDGAISIDEMLLNTEDRAVTRFDILDRDDDGFVSAREFRRKLRAMARLREVRRDCRDEVSDVAALLGG